MAISQQPPYGLLSDFESRWVAITGVYSNIYMNLAYLLEVQESDNVVYTH